PVRAFRVETSPMTTRKTFLASSFLAFMASCSFACRSIGWPFFENGGTLEIIVPGPTKKSRAARPGLCTNGVASPLARVQQMTGNQLGVVLDYLRRSTALHGEGSRTDGQLLGDFTATGDQAAFEALVRRHGPLVLSVCRSVLGNEHDSEDA